MADENSRYNVTITLDIKDATTGVSVYPFGARTIQQYDNMTYEQMQLTQATAIPALLAALMPIGNGIAEEIKAKRGQGQAKQNDKFER